MRYLKTGTRVYFLKPAERFETGGYTRIDSDTSVRRYVRTMEPSRRTKFLNVHKIRPSGYLTLRLRGFSRRNFPNEHYDDHILSNRFWFFRNLGDRPDFEPDFVWDLGSRRKRVVLNWKTVC